MGDARALFDEALAETSAQTANKPKSRTSLRMVAKRVKTLVRSGEVGRALRAVIPASAVTVTASVVKRMQDMFPAGDDMLVDGRVPPADASHGVPGRTLDYVQGLSKLPKLSGTGLLFMRNEHLALLASADEYRPALDELLRQLAEGTAPSEVITFLRGGRLFPLPKDGADFRPLTLANVLRRCSLQTFVRGHKAECRDACGPLQHGVSCPSGVDQVHKKLLIASAANPTSLVVGLDFQRAFQGIRRQALMDAVSRHAPWAWYTAAAWYDGQAQHVLRDMHGQQHLVTACRGVDQGCPLGAFLFALTMRDPAEASLAFARSLDANAHLLFYLDDGYLVIQADHLEAVLDHMEQLFRSVGMEFNRSKLKIWARPEIVVPGRFLEHRVGFIKCLGRYLRAPGDADSEGLSVLSPLADLSAETERMLRLKNGLGELMANGLDRHTAVTLFRAYAGPAVQYTLRTGIVSPEDARKYDLEVAKAWSDLLGKQVSAAETRLWVPARLGGVGAFSAVARAAPSAWAGWCAVMPDMLRYFNSPTPDALLARTPGLRSSLIVLHARLVEGGAPVLISSSSPEQALGYQRKTSHFMGFVHKRMVQSVMATLSGPQLAFFRSQRGSGSASYLEPPLDDRYVMNNERFTFAVCRRLGHPFAWCSKVPDSEIRCVNISQAGRVCGAILDADGAHGECCSYEGGLVSRHDGLVRTLAALAKRHADPRPRLEQVIPQLQVVVAGQIGTARLDVVMHVGARRRLVDVTVVSPHAGSAEFKAACSRRDGHAARRAAVTKRMKYEHADLVPFALETGGRLGFDARALLHQLASEAPDPVAELQYLYRAVSSVLQDGVARQFGVS